MSFSKIVKKYDKIKRPVDDAAVLSYIYQREKLKAEKGREWAEGLLNSLDAQRARILLAYFVERCPRPAFGHQAINAPASTNNCS